MAVARAMWKGTLKFGKSKLNVKLYSAVKEHTIHFRLLHKTDKEPVRQQMIDSDTGEPVEYKDTQKAFPVQRNRMPMSNRSCAVYASMRSSSRVSRSISSVPSPPSRSAPATKRLRELKRLLPLP